MPTIEIVTTVESEDQAEKLAKTLVDQRLAACVQMEPITSIYRWQGTVESAKEIRCTIKTDSSRRKDIQLLFKTLHPYDLPQWVERTIAPGHAGQAYDAWVAEQARRP
ncbi:MAG TPA: hypothetical protein DDW52_01000 [Planctomycetaceae bacterium]|nr:hypothetical protein [Planctomycetaceae bacterium]